MKVLIADKFEQSGIDGLKAIGCDIAYNPDLKDEALAEAIRDSQADVLVVRSTKVKKPMLEAGGLGLVVRASPGGGELRPRGGRHGEGVPGRRHRAPRGPPGAP